MNNFRKKISDKRLQELFRFGIVGGLATILQVVIYYFLSFVLNHNASLIISYSISLVANFILTVYFTFQVKPTPKKGTGFLASHAINFTLQYIFLNLFIYIGIDKQTAIIPVLAICIPVNFVLVSYAIKKI